MSMTPPDYVQFPAGWYAKKGRLDELKEVCRLDPQAISERDNFDGTPLIRGAEGNHTHVVEYLIALGADVNARTIYNITALHHASLNGNLECIRLLVSKGADVNIKNSKGKTPADWANEAVASQILDILKHPKRSEQINQRDTAGNLSREHKLSFWRKFREGLRGH